MLELLYSGDAAVPAQLQPRRSGSGARSTRGLRLTLERVGAGCDTPSKLAQAGVDPAAVLLALTELEVMGLLVRGDGGATCRESRSPPASPRAYARSLRES